MEKRIPAAIDAEADVLGCLLYNPSQMVLLVDQLRPEDFHQEEHRIIYRAMLALHARGRSCHTTNVVRELRRREELDQIGGDYNGEAFLDVLANRLGTLHSVEEHVEAILSASRYRRLIDAAQRIAEAAYYQQADALEIAEQLIYDIAMGAQTNTVSTLKDMLHEYMEDLEERRKNLEQGIARGVPTGFRDLDHLLGGLQPSCLYTIAARPSLGKTAIALNIVLNIVLHAKHALFFSLEMDKSEITQRILAMETHIDQGCLRDGNIDEVQMRALKARSELLETCDLKCDDRTSTIADLRSKARRMHAQKKLDVIVVDYLQLIESSVNGRAKNETRAEEIAKLSKSLKRLARELRVPIIGLAQLNRDIEKRAGGLPQLSDLGEGSGIEKDSDVVAFLHCEETELEARNQCKPYRLNVIVRKHRNGRIGQVTLVFRPRLTKFQDLEAEGYE